MFTSTEIESARAFTARLSGLLRTERTAMADFIAALADFNRLKLWEPLGYNALFGFLRRELGMSTGAAYYRKVAAELVQKCPEVLDALRSGQLCITVVPHLARVLTPQNREQVLPRFLASSRKEARHLAAELDPHPNPPTRDVVTHVRSIRDSRSGMNAIGARAAPGKAPAGNDPARECGVATGNGTPVENGAAKGDGALLGDGSDRAVTSASIVRSNASIAANEVALPMVFVKAPPRDEQEPLTADTTRLHTTVSNRCLRLLEAARAALSHSHPRANAGEIMEVALGALLAEVAKRKHLVDRPRTPKRKDAPAEVRTQQPESRVSWSRDPIPADVEREVRIRDQERCQWPLHSGGICGETHEIEIDHVVPVPMGGQPIASNLRLLCRKHNLTAARIAYGEEFMARFTGERRSVSD